MQKLLIFLLVGFVLAGCTSIPKGDENGIGTSPLAPVPVKSATAVPVPGGSTAAAKPLTVTVRPPVLLLGSGQGTPGVTPLPLSPAGWKTFTSQAIGVAVDYPADWTVLEQGGAVTFSSPQGLAIHLQAAGASAAGLQCSNLINASGLTVAVCVDPASNEYSASFPLTASGGSTGTWRLATTDAAALEVYKAMLNSLRPTR